MTPDDLTTTFPLIFLTFWACALLLIDLSIPRTRKGITALLAALGLGLALIFTLIGQIGRETTGFNGMVVLDGFSIFVNALLLGSGLLGVALAYGYVRRMGLERGEYYTLLLFSVTGMMLMAQAADLIVVFLALELLSIPLYVLAAFARPKIESEEAGLKYFLLGAFATGFVVYGTALVFGATESTNLSPLSALQTDSNLLLVSIETALILVRLGFKPLFPSICGRPMCIRARRLP
jgi:NADH-quinone oxidoreductase subunit N